MLVEGAGGICVPIRDDYLMSDLARDLDLPLLVVARPSLGTINHTVLTVRFAQAAGLQLLGIIINNYPSHPGLAEESSPGVIERLTGIPVLAKMPADPDMDTEGLQAGNLVLWIEESLLLDRLIAALTLHS
jgi:dethiobiotin synthetase